MNEERGEIRFATQNKGERENRKRGKREGEERAAKRS